MAAPEDPRYQPLYGPSDISRYAHVPARTLREWSGAKGKAIMVPSARGVSPFSFINLIEAHVLVALRKTHNVPMPQIRKAVRWLKDTFETEHPLAEVNLETDGRDLFVDYLGLTVSASARGQIAIPEIVSAYLQRIERDEAGPARFFPFTTYEKCPKIVVMDPRVDFGRPVVVGTRIETAMIFDRYTGGEGLTEIAQDYGLELATVEEALRCEMERRAA